jgi:hypothetical protein
MSVAVEIVGMQKVGHLNDSLWINDDTAKYTTLSLNVLR